MLKRRTIPLLVAMLIVIVGVRGLTFFSKKPTNIGVVNGRLAAPPLSPNCVSSQVGPDRSEYVKPLSIPEGCSDPIEQLAQKLKTLPRIKIVTQNDEYLHAECRSLVLGFVDDLECEMCRKEFKAYSREHLKYRGNGKPSWGGIYSGMWVSDEWVKYKLEHCPRASNTNWTCTEK